MINQYSIFFFFWIFILEKLDKDENIILIKLQIIIIYHLS